MAKREKPWQEKWNTIKPLPGGGQCENFIVNSTNEDIKGDFVLKIIKDSTKLERRVRFYREVHHYITLNHASIPAIVDHNCDESPKVEKRLYFVYGYIEGSNLEEFVQNHGPLTFDNAIQVVLQLADVLEYCHEQDIIHRDIKPDNIILENDDPNKLILIDFGLSASNSDEILDESGGMQLGNRFLYLPELKHDKGNKRDKRSDISYLIGILFYVLTGTFPSHLLDDETKYPHQRVDLDEFRSSEIEQMRINMLKQVFDRGFQFQMNKRFQDVSELKESLKQILNFNKEVDVDYEAIILSNADLSKGGVVEELTNMMPAIQRIFQKLPVNNRFQNVEISISGPSVLPHWDPICIAGHYYLTEKYKRKIAQTYMFKIYPNGVEYILSIFIDEEEHIIQRFQDSHELNDETVKSIENTVWKSFALLM